MKLCGSVAGSAREAKRAIFRGILGAQTRQDESALKQGSLPRAHSQAKTFRKRRIIKQSARTQAAAQLDAMIEARPLTRPGKVIR